jgi:ADP-glucose pyrophosphorylase
MVTAFYAQTTKFSKTLIPVTSQPVMTDIILTLWVNATTAEITISIKMHTVAMNQHAQRENTWMLMEFVTPALTTRW